MSVIPKLIEMVWITALRPSFENCARNANWRVLDGGPLTKSTLALLECSLYAYRVVTVGRGNVRRLDRAGV